METHPPLTDAKAFGQSGVLDPVAFHGRLGHEIARFQRYRIPLSPLIIQLDGNEEIPNPSTSTNRKKTQDQVHAFFNGLIGFKSDSDK